MDFQPNLEQTLRDLQAGHLSVEDALEQINGVKELGYAAIDTDRQRRNGFPEVIFGEGKTVEQMEGIMQFLLQKELPILATRVSLQKGEALSQLFPNGRYYPEARCFVLNSKKEEVDAEHYIAVVTAGTSDVPVAEEAAVTAETFGHAVHRIYDVGVAGIHRLFRRLDEIQKASVVIVIAGMEGALVSVVGGLVDVPVIAVPTSIGYGSNLQGLTTLMSMLTSCASGVTVVNIDNGFGAAYSACMINRLNHNRKENK